MNCCYYYGKYRSKKYLLCSKIVQNGSSGKSDSICRLANGIMYTFFWHWTVLFRKININPLLLLFCYSVAKNNSCWSIDVSVSYHRKYALLLFAWTHYPKMWRSLYILSKVWFCYFSFVTLGWPHPILLFSVFFLSDAKIGAARRLQCGIFYGQNVFFF